MTKKAFAARNGGMWLVRVAALGLAVLGCLPSFADVLSSTVDGIEWKYEVKDGKASICGGEPTTGVLAIPSTLGGYPVTSIGGLAFWNCSVLTTVYVRTGDTERVKRMMGGAACPHAAASVRRVGDNAPCPCRAGCVAGRCKGRAWGAAFQHTPSHRANHALASDRARCRDDLGTVSERAKHALADIRAQDRTRDGLVAALSFRLF